MMTRDDLVRRASLGGVIIATVVISYTILRDRAVNIGFSDWWTAWLYPIGLDALILGASRVWGQRDISPGTRRMAMIMTLAAIGAGIAAFIVEFMPRGWVAVGFAVLIPASLAASLVLTSRVAADKRDGYVLPKPDATEEDLGWSPDEREMYGMDDTDDPVEFEPGLLSMMVHTEEPTREDPHRGEVSTPEPIRFRPVPPTAAVNVDPTAMRNGDRVTFTPDVVQRADPSPDLASLAHRARLSDEQIHREDLERATRGLPPLADNEHINEKTMVIPVVSATGPRPDTQQPPTPPEQSTRSVSNNRASGGVSADVRKSWVRSRLENGVETTGADVDREFPEGSRNGARIVRQVREQMEREAKE